MQKSLHKIFCICFAVTALSGCCGMIVAYPGECDKETPATFFKNMSSSKQTKADFLKELGKPDAIETTSENRETWIYNKHLWCGAVPCWLVCAPLVLPVCDGFNKLYFQGDVAKRLHTRRTLMAGIIMVGFAGTAESENACIKPLPPSLIQKIQPNKTFSLSVTIDTPEHQQDEDYNEVAKRLRELLPTKLVGENDGVFKSVVPEAEPADYAIEIIVTSANIPGKFAIAMGGGWCYAYMKVHVTNTETNQQIANFKIGAGEEKTRAFTIDEALTMTIQDAVGEIVKALNTVDDIYNSNLVDEDQKESDCEVSK